MGILGEISRLGSLVAAHISQGALVLGSEVAVPLGKVTDKVNLVCLAAVDSLEVVVAVQRVEFVIVCKLLLGDGLLALQAEDSVDVLLPFNITQSSPSEYVSMEIEALGSFSPVALTIPS